MPMSRPVGRGRCACESMRDSISLSTASDSLKPSAPKNLMPLSSMGLCEAEIITPAAASMLLVMAATAGVGTMPSCTTWRPVDVMPATIAPSSIGPDKRVSRPTTIGFSIGWSCAITAAPARPIAYASSGVRSAFATPRTPSVPKYLPIVLFLIPVAGGGDELRAHAHEVRRYLDVRDLLAVRAGRRGVDHGVELLRFGRDRDLDAHARHLREIGCRAADGGALRADVRRLDHDAAAVAHVVDAHRHDVFFEPGERDVHGRRRDRPGRGVG